MRITASFATPYRTSVAMHNQTAGFDATFCDAVDSARCAAAQRNTDEALRWCAIAATLATTTIDALVYHNLANDIQRLVAEASF